MTSYLTNFTDPHKAGRMFALCAVNPFRPSDIRKANPMRTRIVVVERDNGVDDRPATEAAFPANAGGIPAWPHIIIRQPRPNSVEVATVHDGHKFANAWTGPSSPLDFVDDMARNVHLGVHLHIAGKS